MGASAGRGGAPDPGSQARRQAAVAFCSALWALPDGDGLAARDELDDLFVTIFITPDNRCEWIPASDPDKIVDRIVALDDAAQAAGRGDVYIGATLTGARESLPRDKDGGLRRRPHAEDARALVGLWVDLDVAELGGHSDRPYPATLADAWAILDRLPIAPTVVLHSGHGLQAWWCLTEPWRFGEIGDQEPDREAAANLARDWVHTVRVHAEDAGGWYVDPVFDLARLLRPAGTTNRKSEPKAVRVERADGPTYDLDDLYAALADDKVLERYRSPRVGPDELGGIDLHKAWARATSMANRERDYTPPWVAAMIEAVDTTPLAIAWDEGYDADDPSAVDAKLCRFLFDVGVTTEQVAEAVMSLHLRTGHKVDKVDPHRRTDYLVTTVGKFRATSAAAKAKREAARSRLDEIAAHAAGQRVGKGALTPEPREDETRRVAPAAPDPVAPRAPTSTWQPEHGAVADSAVPAPQRDGGSPQADEATPDVGAAEATPGINEPGHDEDTPQPERVTDPPTEVGTEPPRAKQTPGSLGTSGAGPDSPETVTGEVGAHDALAQHVLDRVRHPADEVGGWEEGAPRATPPPPRTGASIADPFGKREEFEAQLLGELTALLINPMYVAEGVEVWRVEYRNQGAKAEGRLILRLPDTFAWPTGERPPLYHPGRPLATSWLPRSDYQTYKGFHAALMFDVLIIPREVAGKGAEVQEHQADPSSWRAVIQQLVPFWRPDSSRTDLASAVTEWLLSLLCERPALRDIDEAVSSGRPWLADPVAWSPESPPRIVVPKRVLLDYFATQPGSPGPGPGSGSMLEFLRVTRRTFRDAGPVARRAEWLEIEPDQFDQETWATIIEDTANALMARERQQQARKHLSLVADGERSRTGTEEMQRRQVEAGLAVGDEAALGDVGMADPEDTES